MLKLALDSEYTYIYVYIHPSIHSFISLFQIKHDPPECEPILLVGRPLFINMVRWCDGCCYSGWYYAIVVVVIIGMVIITALMCSQLY